MHVHEVKDCRKKLTTKKLTSSALIELLSPYFKIYKHIHTGLMAV